MATKAPPDKRHPFHERPGDAQNMQALCALCGKNRGAVAHSRLGSNVYMGTVKPDQRRP